MINRMQSDSDKNPLRDEIFKLLSDKSTLTDDAETALLQCASQIQNKRLLERTAAECDLQLCGFLCDDVLELYYNIKRGEQGVGYISKGWEDSGFRVGELLKVPKTKGSSLKTHIFSLLKFCATRGVSVTFEEVDDAIEIQMDSVIYSDGFNKQVFEQVLHYLNVCVDKVNAVIE